MIKFSSICLGEDATKAILARGRGRVAIPVTYEGACSLLGRHNAVTTRFDKPIPNVVITEPWCGLDYDRNDIPDEIMYQWGGGMYPLQRTLHSCDSGLAGPWKKAGEMPHVFSRLTVTFDAGALLAKPFANAQAISWLSKSIGFEGVGDLEEEWFKKNGELATWGLFAEAIRDDEKSAKPSPALDTNAFDHELKTWPPQFQSIWDGLKTFEVRSTRDRRFVVGQRIKLREWRPANGEYTGRTMVVRVTYVLTGAADMGINISTDTAVFSIKIEEKHA